MYARTAISRIGIVGHSGMRHAWVCLWGPRRESRAATATRRYMPVTETPVTPYRVSRLTKQRIAPGTPTARVATQGEPKRPSLEKTLLTGSGQALSRAEANRTREFWMTMTMPALMIARATQRLTKVPTAEFDQAVTMLLMSPPVSCERSDAPMVIATTGTRMTTVEIARVARTVRATLRRGFSSSSER